MVNGFQNGLYFINITTFITTINVTQTIHSTKLASYSQEAVRASIKVMRDIEAPILHKVNQVEMELLLKRLASDDFKQVVQSFMGNSFAYNLILLAIIRILVQSENLKCKVPLFIDNEINGQMHLPQQKRTGPEWRLFVFGSYQQ